MPPFSHPERRKATAKSRPAQTIRDAVEEKLIVFPDCNQVKKLTNHQYQYRLRVGNYRVFFNFDGEIHIVDIHEVKKRDGTTY
ncbi:type II toxin-antitoxin system RelE/ParE family toxin [Nitrosomonas communis]|uniref:type II toxin-antitoxin system RelE family toxin n=1 Tax=Nitrosomonas communis TaxID=44574 RepID=UPI0026EA5A68|nr:type II toxin-antitoxin system RelE/ParE family toxin [Nitrosomonas communis]